MRLKAMVRWPISSCDVTASVSSSLPASTARAFRQPMNRAGQSGADNDREDEPQRGGEHGENDGNDHHGLLLANSRRRVRLQQLEHVRTDGVEFAVEFVAQHVDSIELVGHRFVVAAVEERQQACDLIVEAAVGIVHEVDQAGIEPHQSRRIAEFSSLGDQPVEQGARGLRFVVDLFGAGFERLPRSDELLVVHGRLHFLDHYAAQRHGALERADIGPGQRAVSRNVALRKIFQATCNLHDQRHRQQSRDGHQHDQDQGDPDDLALDR
jgi:hypothetical protein